MNVASKRNPFVSDFVKWLLLVAILIFLPISGYSQTEVPDTVEIQEEVESENYASVVVDGEPLFNLRGYSVAPAQERADNVAARIIEAAEVSNKPTVIIDIIDGEFGPTITVDGINVTVVTTADAEHEAMEIDLLVKVQAKVIEETIFKYRSERSEEGRSESIKLALLWTLPFLLGIFILFWVRKRVEYGVEQLVIRLSAGIDSASRNIIQSSVIVMIARALVRIILLIIFLLILKSYLSVLFSAFPETRNIANIIRTYVTAPIIDIFIGAVGQVPNLIILTLLYLLTKYIVKLVRLVFENIESGNFKFEGFEKQWVWPTYNLLRAFIWVVWFILAFPYIPGSDSEAFKGVSILLGVMVSMGSNSVVGNILAGIFVIYRRSTSIGDRIKVGNHIGDVVAIKLMETQLKSIKNELISIPNSTLMSSEVINYSTLTDSNGLLVHTTVGIGYEEPQTKVEQLLIDAAIRTKSLKKSPKPFVLRNLLADYSVHYQVNAYTTHGKQLPIIMSDLHANILDVFNENNVQIMTPSYIADPDEPKIAPISTGKHKK